MVWECVLEVDRERLERLFPPRALGPDRWPPVFIEVAHGEVEHLQRGLLGGELAPVAGDLAQSGVHRLDQVRNRYEDLGVSGPAVESTPWRGWCARHTVRPSGTGAPGVKQGGQADLVRWAESPC